MNSIFHFRGSDPMPGPLETTEDYHSRVISERYVAPRGSRLAILRIEAHKSFDVLWHFDAFPSRNAAYRWLAEKMNLSTAACHIGMFDEVQCRRVIEICENRK